MSKEKHNYHHGDLQNALLTTAIDLLEEDGIDALSLRKLAEKVGVSRTAVYHHFVDKHALLCAIAAKGFEQWQSIAQRIQQTQYKTNADQYRDFVFHYLDFATTHPHLYNLMFGQTIWKNQQATIPLEESAFPTFEHQVEMIEHWQLQKLLPSTHSALRVSQVIWGTLHGIAKLTIDGIYTEQSSIDEMCQCAIDLFINANK